MDWPKSAGKGVETYVEEEHSRLKRAEFEKEIRAFVGSLAAKLTTDDYQVLFEIADEYARRESFVIKIRNGNFLLHEWQAKAALISKARDLSSRFTQIVNAGLADQQQPVRLLAQSISDRLSKPLKLLEAEFELVETFQRANKRMLESHSLKTLPHDLVVNLEAYIEDVIFSRLSIQERSASNKEMLIASVFSASQIAPEWKRKGKDIVQRVGMKRSRAKEYLRKEFYEKDEFPVVQLKPKKKTGV